MYIAVDNVTKLPLEVDVQDEGGPIVRALVVGENRALLLGALVKVFGQDIPWITFRYRPLETTDLSVLQVDSKFIWDGVITRSRA